MTDTYTKSVLTVIACALGAIALENAVPRAHAGFDAPQKVMICDYSKCANLRPVVDVLHGKPETSWGLAVINEPN